LTLPRIITYQTSFGYEIGVFHGAEDSSRILLGCDAV